MDHSPVEVKLAKVGCAVLHELRADHVTQVGLFYAVLAKVFKQLVLLSLLRWSGEKQMNNQHLGQSLFLWVWAFVGQFWAKSLRRILVHGFEVERLS